LTRSGDVRLPKIYVKTIADLEDFMNEAMKKDKSSAKKMNTLNARALNGMKQKLRKNNRDYEKDISEYKADKEAFMKEEEAPVVLPTPKPTPSIQNVAPVEDDDDGFAVVGKGGKVLHFTPEGILKTLRDILEQRGKKNTDRGEHIKTMEVLLNISQTTYQKIRVLLVLIPTRFDLTSGSQSFMNADQWKL
jgi:translation initiation factor 3 subunit C